MTDPAWREDFKRTLTRRSLLRVHMALILLGAGATGFMASLLLVGVGLTDMGPRWGLAVLAAWLAFLLLRIWRIYPTRGARRRGASDVAAASTHAFDHDHAPSRRRVASA